MILVTFLNILCNEPEYIGQCWILYSYFNPYHFNNFPTSFTSNPTTSPISVNPTEAPIACEDNESLGNNDCVDQECDANKPYLDFTVSFNVCNKKPFNGNRYHMVFGMLLRIVYVLSVKMERLIYQVCRLEESDV